MEKVPVLQLSKKTGQNLTASANRVKETLAKALRGAGRFCEQGCGAGGSAGGAPRGGRGDDAGVILSPGSVSPVEIGLTSSGARLC